MTFSRSFAILLAMSLGTTWLSTEAFAGPPADSKAVLQQRLDELGKHFQGGELARWSKPDDRAALEKVWDIPAILGKPPYIADDVGILAQILNVQVELINRYSKAGGARSGTDKEARVRVKYQDEIVHNSVFMVATATAMLEAIGDFASKLKPEDLKPERREGLDRGRIGVRSIIRELTVELRFAGVSSANRMVLLDALAANAPTIAAYSPDVDRKGYLESANDALPNLSEPEKAKLKVFMSAMETKDCKGLCALKG